MVKRQDIRGDMILHTHAFAGLVVMSHASYRTALRC